MQHHFDGKGNSCASLVYLLIVSIIKPGDKKTLYRRSGLITPVRKVWLDIG